MPRATTSARLGAAILFGVVALPGGSAVSPHPVSAQLGTALEVRSLDFEQATEGFEVELEGIVIFSDPPATAFLQDETAGTFFRLEGRPPPRAGARVRVRGHSFPGLYLPGVERTEFEVIGYEGLPAGREVDYDDLASGRYHYERVSLEGIVRSLRPDGEGVTLVRLATGARILEVRVEEIPPDEDRLSDSLVRVSGLAAGRINHRRQLVEPYLRCQDWGELEVLRPAPALGALRIISPEELMAFDVRGRAGHRVRVAGTVLASLPQGELFLRTGDTALGVRLSEPSPRLRGGDAVEVVGFPEMGQFSASLADAILLDHVRGEEPPEALRIEWSEAYDGTRDSDLVTLEGTVSDWYREARGAVVVLRQDRRSIQVRSPALPDPIPLGSYVEATGICRVEATRGAQYRSEPETVSLTLASAEGLRVLRAARWWTTSRLVSALVTLGVFFLFAGLWIVLLRRQVARQTAALRGRIENEAALEERQRLAREFHDTLEQDLAGLALRLDAATSRNSDGRLRDFLEGSRRLVTRIQSETRNLVADLRDSHRDAGNLNEALESLAAEAIPGIGPALALRLAELPPIPARATHHLKMMVREAVANALKHSGATRIAIATAVEDGALRLEISDDGRGFDPETHTRGRPGHFGCMGMRERARRISAEVAWTSEPGEGATVRILYPLD